MKKAQLDRRPRPSSKQRDVVTPLLAFVALVAVCALGWVAVDLYAPSTSVPNQQATDTTAQAGVMTASFGMCGRDRFTCVVDGDTIWYQGQNLRLQSYDTPEPHDGICGGNAEVALANRASARLLQLLNGNSFTLETFGVDNTGSRTLATIRIDGQDVGDILIEERLARRWPDGDEWWC